MALIPQEPARRTTLLVAFLALAGLYFFHSYWYTPRADQVEELQARFDRLEAGNRQARLIAARGGQELEERLARYQRHLNRLEQLIPGSEEVAALVNQISDEALRTGVILQELNTDPRIFAGDAPYQEQTYTVGVLGEYHDIGRFLTSIASLPRIMTPVDLAVGPPQGGAGQHPQASQMEAPVFARFRVRTFVVQDPAGDPSAGVGGGR